MIYCSLKMHNTLRFMLKFVLLYMPYVCKCVYVIKFVCVYKSYVYMIFLCACAFPEMLYQRVSAYMASLDKSNCVIVLWLFAFCFCCIMQTGKLQYTQLQFLCANSERNFIKFLFHFFDFFQRFFLNFFPLFSINLQKLAYLTCVFVHIHTICTGVFACCECVCKYFSNRANSHCHLIYMRRIVNIYVSHTHAYTYIYGEMQRCQYRCCFCFLLVVLQRAITHFSRRVIGCGAMLLGF